MIRAGRGAGPTPIDKARMRLRLVRKAKMAQYQLEAGCRSADVG
jgi:hypothetical protein